MTFPTVLSGGFFETSSTGDRLSLYITQNVLTVAIGSQIFSSASSPRVGVPVHIVFSMSVVREHFDLYLDGAVVLSSAFDSSVAYLNNRLSVGNANRNFSYGVFSRFRLYNYALTGADVLRRYGAGNVFSWSENSWDYVFPGSPTTPSFNSDFSTTTDGWYGVNYDAAPPAALSVSDSRLVVSPVQYGSGYVASFTKRIREGMDAYRYFGRLVITFSEPLESGARLLIRLPGDSSSLNTFSGDGVARAFATFTHMNFSVTSLSTFNISISSLTTPSDLVISSIDFAFVGCVLDLDPKRLVAWETPLSVLRWDSHPTTGLSMDVSTTLSEYSPSQVEENFESVTLLWSDNSGNTFDLYAPAFSGSQTLRVDSDENLEMLGRSRAVMLQAGGDMYANVTVEQRREGVGRALVGSTNTVSRDAQ